MLKTKLGIKLCMTELIYSIIYIISIYIKYTISCSANVKNYIYIYVFIVKSYIFTIWASREAMYVLLYVCVCVCVCVCIKLLEFRQKSPDTSHERGEKWTVETTVGWIVSPQIHMLKPWLPILWQYLDIGPKELIKVNCHEGGPLILQGCVLIERYWRACSLWTMWGL